MSKPRPASNFSDLHAVPWEPRQCCHWPGHHFVPTTYVLVLLHQSQHAKSRYQTWNAARICFPHVPDWPEIDHLATCLVNWCNVTVLTTCYKTCKEQTSCRLNKQINVYVHNLPWVGVITRMVEKNISKNYGWSKSLVNFSANGPSQPTTKSAARTAASSLLVSKSRACRSTTRRARRHSAQKCWKHVGIEKKWNGLTQN